MATAEVEAFWTEFTGETGVDAPYEAWAFGLDTDPGFATELALLVRDGPKRATAGLLEDYTDEPLPAIGDYSVILDGAGTPICVIRTTGLEVRPFVEVDESFAWDEGEGDRTLEWWRGAHRRFFARIGVELTDETEMVLERFELLWPQG